MATETSYQHEYLLREEPTEETGYQTAKLQILALEERSNALFTPTQQLRTAGYQIQAIFEENRTVSKILAATDDRFLILTVQDTCRPLRVPQVIEALRRSGYERPISYCVNGKVSCELRTAYEALSVDRVLSIPAQARDAAGDGFTWLRTHAFFRDSGIIILEV